MAKERAELFIEGIYKSNIQMVRKSVINRPDLKPMIELEFDNLLKGIYRKFEKIYNYVNTTGKRKQFIIQSNTENFTFNYTIEKDNTSSITVIIKTKLTRTYDAGHLVGKMGPIDGYVYFVKSEYGYKIGKTKRLHDRIRAFIVDLPFKVDLHSYIRTKHYSELELSLHKLLDHKRLNGEWFNLEKNDFIELDKYLFNRTMTRMYIEDSDNIVEPKDLYNF